MHLDQVMDVVGEPSDAPTDPQTSAPA
jgi:hypothetical protein